MAKQLNVILDDHEHQALLNAKGTRSWRNFIKTLNTEVRTVRTLRFELFIPQYMRRLIPGIDSTEH